MNKTVQTTINDLLSGDLGRYGYLFPYRDRIPRVTTHPFTDLKKSSMKADQYVASKMLDLDLIGWTAKAVLNLDLFPIQIAILQIMWTHPFPMLVASRGGSKSFILAVYAILRALLDPGSKIVIVGAGLRQAKIVFNYIDQVWNSAPVFRSIIGGGKKAGPRQSVDLCYFKIGESIVYALPLGDGAKIRGFRANVVIADEFSCLNGNTYLTYGDRFGLISDGHDISIVKKNTLHRDVLVWGNGQFRKSPQAYCNGEHLTKIIQTGRGNIIEGTHNHKVRVLRNNCLEWVRFDEIQIDGHIPIDRSWRWHGGKTSITADEAYGIGLLPRLR
ncbi:hypothetical protein LCGC14_1422640 [marine sediment metagenome]|uniref:Uncharacterized protein n=1 Tax=marine sediment metagenome TaxID=412755 RepID=A0A0F9KC14_9ZZZZ